MSYSNDDEVSLYCDRRLIAIFFLDERGEPTYVKSVPHVAATVVEQGCTSEGQVKHM